MPVLRVLVGASLVVLAAQAPPPPAVPAGRGMLIGQVIEAGTTRPVAGAVVTLGGAPSMTSSNVVFSFPQAQLPGGNRLTVTSAQGHFVFADLPGGTYSLQATKPGYSPGGYGKRRATGAAQAVIIDESERVGDLTIPLFRHATISGTVTDEAGDPVVGISIRAMRRTYENARPEFTVAASGMSATTNDRGEYRLTTLIPGEYMIAITSTSETVPLSTIDAYNVAVAAGTGIDFTRELSASDSALLGSMRMGLPVGDQSFLASAFGSSVATPPPPSGDGKITVYPMQFYPSATDSSDATVIALRAGDDRSGIDMVLRPVATSRVTGTVVGPSGAARHIGLSLVPAVTSLVSDRFFETATTITDAQGAFVFLGVPAGQYRLRALRRPLPPPSAAPPTGLTTVIQTGSSTAFMGSPDPEGSRPTTQIPDGPTLWAEMPVTVDRTDLTGLTVTLQTGFRVAGQFAFDGGTTRPAPEAIRRQLVVFESVSGRFNGATVTRAVIDNAGKLSTYQMPPGKYLVRVQGSIPGWTFAAAMVDGVDVSDRPLDLQGDVSDLVLTYTNRPSGIVGTVRASSGAPDGGAQVLVFPTNATAPDFTDAPRRLRSARVTRSGTYQVTALPPGDYFIVAIADEAAADFPSSALIGALARQATRIRISAGETRTMDLITIRTR